jgi:hypothetical protein
MKKNLCIAFAICCVTFIQSQSVGDMKIKQSKFGLNNIKKAPKKIFINTFNINYEFYREAIDYKNGGNGGRIAGNKGSATARAAVGLGGINANEILKETNKIYKEFLDRLNSEGYEVISAEEAGKTDTYRDWKIAKGPYAVEEIPGMMTCMPEGYAFFYKKKTDNGKIKRGTFGNSMVLPKLSKELGDAVIADINLYVMFSENGTNLLSGGAKVKIKTNLRLANQYIFTVPKKLKKKKSVAGKLFGSVQIKGAVDTYTASSSVAFTQGKMKVGLGAMAQYTGTLKEDLEIEGVLSKQKIVAYQKQGSFVPTSFSTFSDYLDAKEDKFSTTTKWINVDGNKYKEGFYNACHIYLEKQMDEFFNKIK